MITSNTKKLFGGKVATVETPSFSCLISTAKEGLFCKQSMVIFDTTKGFSNRSQVAKLLFNDLLDSIARIGFHDMITHSIDESGMNGNSLCDTLTKLIEGLQKEGIALAVINDDWFISNA